MRWFASFIQQAHFKGKRLAPELFKTIESTSSTPLPENVLYVKRNLEGVVRVTAKAYIQKPGSYRFDIRRVGRTADLFRRQGSPLLR